MSVQLLHCSDIHLDRNFSISNMARAQERKEDLNKNFSVAVEYALENKPEIFLVTGDVFDRVSPGNAARIFLTEKVRRLKDAGIAVLMIAGNHEVPNRKPCHGMIYIDGPFSHAIPPSPYRSCKDRTSQV